MIMHYGTSMKVCQTSRKTTLSYTRAISGAQLLEFTNTPTRAQDLTSISTTVQDLLGVSTSSLIPPIHVTVP